ncbi:RuBisCO large subunit C-terminal-like domain-containing protein [Clostridium scatologenes]|uniref:Ribulose-bisphosphate carboxylase n=1 Tax=Clostridium scatologenes TaxID=1548 RepID=A0A0E3JYC9_CLOSL|nr:RuBisCO large subunit C-terminal-like domain-containing protein [Clostridium scatologenes]AKA67395.1 Ribulose-bisphosphate carboxylase [Clostridium scatologenes]
MFFTGKSDLKLPQERFSVTYKLQGDEKEAYRKAQDICIEQTVEFPEDVVPEGIIKDNIVGKIESFSKLEEEVFQVNISYPEDATAYELTQLINVIFGNTSIKPGVRVEEVNLSKKITDSFKGPRFGIKGIRKLLNVPKRPLLFTALKPMGISAEELAHIAYEFAIGGIDIIKDDHGLTNQPFCPYEKRVKLCSEAVQKANDKTGRNAIYVPNITASASEILDRAGTAKKFGAGGVLIAPGLTGFDVMRQVADDESISLPVVSHPAFQGSFVLGNEGISHKVLFGDIARISGADATIYPNFLGRFSFSREECVGVSENCKKELGKLKSVLPCPSGGMNLENIPESYKAYGDDVAFLIGGGLFRKGYSIADTCKYFKNLVENI